MLACLGFSGWAPAQQEQEDKRAKEALRRLQSQQREFNEEKERLEQEKTKLEKDLSGREGDLKQLKSRIDKAESGTRRTEAELKQKSAELERKSSELQAAGTRLAQEQEKTRLLQLELAKRVEEIRQRDAERNVLASQAGVQREIVGRQAQIIQACEEKNLALYRVGEELLERYRKKGVMDALKQAEPFTGIEQVRVENLWQEYRDKLDTQKIDKSALAQ
ncbi:MAG: hypothetical protein ACKVP2_14670 [Burkholderiales bacterium]